MKLALLGTDPLALALVQAAVGNGRHEMTAYYEPGDNYLLLKDLMPQAVLGQSWEELLTGGGCDGVIVAAGDVELRAEQLRRICQAGLAALVVQPACEAIVYYELEMIRRDTGAVLVPYVPGRWHPAIEQLARLARQQPEGVAGIGHCEQIVLERTLADGERSLVLAQLARDLELLRALIGDMTKVSALGPASGAAVYSHLGVQLSGPAGILARWSSSVTGGGADDRLVMVGAAGKATLLMTGDESQWRLEIAAGQETAAREFPDADSRLAALDQLALAISGQAIAPSWLDACRDLEIADSVEPSLRRGKTIELQLEQPTEEGTFKGMMAVGGCLMLSISLLAVFVASLVEGLKLPIRHQLWWKLWPVYLLLPLVVFLLLQLLRFVFPAADRSINDASEPRK